MFTLLLVLAAYGGWRLVKAAIQAVPRRNEDMIFY
jgi:hypothetical protein